MRIVILDSGCCEVGNQEELLNKNHYITYVAKDKKELFACLEERGADLLLINEQRELGSVGDLLQTLRREGRSEPIFVLTDACVLTNIVALFEAGADDVIRENCPKQELLARIKAIARRKGAWKEETICHRDLAFRPESGMLSCKENSLILMQKDAGVLEVLLSEPERIYSAMELLDIVWGDSAERSEELVWSSMYRLRKNLKKIGSTAEIINVRGRGYLLKTGKNS